MLGAGLFFLARPALAAYHVGSGDVLDLAVSQEPKLTGKFTVDEDGALQLELLGKVDVRGRTVEEIDGLLQKKLKVYFKQPTVRVSVAEYRSQKVYVLGAVARPGAYVLAGDRTLLDELLEAGGTTPGATGRVVLVHAEQGARVAANGVLAASKDDDPNDSVVVDLPKVLSGASIGGTNMPVRNGDFILVPGSDDASGGAGVVDSGEAQVTVVGEVQHPGLFRLEPGATGLAAVLAAGGLTKYASPNRAKVIRARDGGRTVLSLQLGDIMKHGEKKKDVVLEPGDMIIVPARLF